VSEVQLLQISSEVEQEKQLVTFRNWTTETAVQPVFELNTECLMNDTSTCYPCAFTITLFGITSGMF